MIETELSGERMGDTVFADSATLSALVRAGEGQTLEVIKNGQTIERVSISADPFTHERSVEAPAEGEDRYRHQVTIGNTPQTVGSYVWLRAEDRTETPDAGAPGCRIAMESDRDTAVLTLAFAFVVLLSRRRRSC
jgi:hypothetical protein